MIRVLNFFCVAVMGLSILALYHVSEQTRIARIQLQQVGQRDRRCARSDERAANGMGARGGSRPHPGACGIRSGHDDTATVQLSSLDAPAAPRR